MELVTFALGGALTCAAVDRGSRGSGSRPPATPPPARRRALDADELFSLRARRRAAAYLRMRLLELRRERLERAADVIEHRAPVDELIHAP
jgi:hypothetical protein